MTPANLSYFVLGCVLSVALYILSSNLQNAQASNVSQTPAFSTTDYWILDGQLVKGFATAKEIETLIQ